MPIVSHLILLRTENKFCSSLIIAYSHNLGSWDFGEIKKNNNKKNRIKYMKNCNDKVSAGSLWYREMKSQASVLWQLRVLVLALSPWQTGRQRAELGGVGSGIESSWRKLCNRSKSNFSSKHIGLLCGIAVGLIHSFLFLFNLESPPKENREGCFHLAWKIHRSQGDWLCKLTGNEECRKCWCTCSCEFEGPVSCAQTSSVEFSLLSTICSGVYCVVLWL